jgi:hypothetical protein
MDKKTFFRVSNIESEQGLWYDRKGNFTGLIHNKFDFCANSSLRMDFDEKLRGYLSTTDEFNTLYRWFTKEDILRLQNHGFFIHEYEAHDYWFYEPFQHWVVNQESSIITKRIILF